MTQNKFSLAPEQRRSLEFSVNHVYVSLERAVNTQVGLDAIYASGEIKALHEVLERVSDNRFFIDLQNSEKVGDLHPFIAMYALGQGLTRALRERADPDFSTRNKVFPSETEFSEASLTGIIGRENSEQYGMLSHIAYKLGETGKYYSVLNVMKSTLADL